MKGNFTNLYLTQTFACTNNSFCFVCQLFSSPPPPPPPFFLWRQHTGSRRQMVYYNHFQSPSTSLGSHILSSRVDIMCTAFLRVKAVAWMPLQVIYVQMLITCCLQVTTHQGCMNTVRPVCTESLAAQESLTLVSAAHLALSNTPSPSVSSTPSPKQHTQP